MKKHPVFTVKGKPFYSIGIQAHNSGSSSPAQLADAYNAAKMLGVNTVAVPIPWDRFEPVEGEWDTAFLTDIIDGARENDLHIVLLWFGIWKNGTMEYVPAWVKKDTTRFPRVELKDGKKVLNLSPHYEPTYETEKRAFIKMMETLRDYDADTQTVIAVQVENEPGYFSATKRDFSVWGQKAFESAVPQELIDWCVAYPQCDVAKKWQKAGCVKSGNWAEVFGVAGAEYLTAWTIAKYIDALAGVGKEIYDIFTYLNVWIAFGRGLAGVDWPAGTPLFRNADVYFAALKNIDSVAPDIYLPEVTQYLRALEVYQRKDIDFPLYIPESARTLFNSGMMFEAVGAGTIGFHVFGGESLLTDTQDGLTDEGKSMMHSFKMLMNLVPVLPKYIGTDKLRAIHRRGVETHQLIEDLEGGWRAYASFVGTLDNYQRMDCRHKEACFEEVTGIGDEPARGLLLQESEDVFYLVGHKFRLFFLPEDNIDGSIDAMTASVATFPTNAEYITVEEGMFTAEGEFVPVKPRTGDESRHGTYAQWNCGVTRIVLNRVD